MDLSSTKYLEPPAVLFSSQGQGGASLEANNTSIKNPFLDTFPDAICKVSLKETSEFVKSFPVPESRGILQSGDNNSVERRNIPEAPPTPGRPVFSFTNGHVGLARKSFPSKWDDAEKWLVSGGSCHENNNSHGLLKTLEQQQPSRMFSKQCSGYKPRMGEIFAEKSRVTEERVSKVISTFHGPFLPLNGVSLSATEDKFPNEVNPVVSPKLGCSMQEGFLFQHSEMFHEVKHRDIGTEMTPLGSSATSRCPTPFKSTSPARHNTPDTRSGPLALSSSTFDIRSHLAKLHWSSREEEEEDVSKSLRHFEMSNEYRRSVSECKPCNWEQEEKTKSCLRYQREEAKIQAWVNLQCAKAEAESRKLEVKIQKMRSNLEEKLMKRMGDVQRKAEEWRAAAQFQHSQQIRKVGQQARKLMSRNNSNYNSCGCFPCNNHVMHDEDHLTHC